MITVTPFSINVLKPEVYWKQMNKKNTNDSKMIIAPVLVLSHLVNLQLRLTEIGELKNSGSYGFWDVVS